MAAYQEDGTTLATDLHGGGTHTFTLGQFAEIYFLHKYGGVTFAELSTRFPGARSTAGAAFHNLPSILEQLGLESPEDLLDYVPPVTRVLLDPNLHPQQLNGALTDMPANELLDQFLVVSNGNIQRRPGDFDTRLREILKHWVHAGGANEREARKRAEHFLDTLTSSSADETVADTTHPRIMLIATLFSDDFLGPESNYAMDSYHQYRPGSSKAERWARAHDMIEAARELKRSSVLRDQDPMRVDLDSIVPVTLVKNGKGRGRKKRNGANGKNGGNKEVHDFEPVNYPTDFDTKAVDPSQLVYIGQVEENLKNYLAGRTKTPNKKKPSAGEDPLHNVDKLSADKLAGEFIKIAVATNGDEITLSRITEAYVRWQGEEAPTTRKAQTEVYRRNFALLKSLYIAAYRNRQIKPGQLETVIGRIFNFAHEEFITNTLADLNTMLQVGHNTQAPPRRGMIANLTAIVTPERDKPLLTELQKILATIAQNASVTQAPARKSLTVQPSRRRRLL